MLPRLALIGILLVLPLIVSCGDQAGPAPAGPSAKPTEYTAILFNGQKEGTTETRAAAGQSIKGWTVVDTSRQPALTPADIPADFRNQKGVLYAYKRADVFEGKKLWMGDNPNPYEITVMSVEIDPPEKENRQVTYIVSDADAQKLRSDPAIQKLIKRCNIAFLLGKLGD
jgi:hypothetical protein